MNKIALVIFCLTVCFSSQTLAETIKMKGTLGVVYCEKNPDGSANCPHLNFDMKPFDIELDEDGLGQHEMTYEIHDEIFKGQISIERDTSEDNKVNYVVSVFSSHQEVGNDKLKRTSHGFVSVKKISDLLDIGIWAPEVDKELTSYQPFIGVSGNP